MPVSAATLRKLMDAGLEGESLLDIVASIDADMAAPVKKRSAGAIRQQRYRERHSDVTSDVTVTPPDKEKVAPKEINPPKEKTPKGVQKKRAVRLPDDFVPDLDWAIAQGLSRQTAEMQAAKFRDYWKAAKDGAKLDWPATWRNWIRNSLDRMGIQPPPSAPKPERWRGFGTDKWAALMAHVRNTGEWSPAWGPPPSAAGCKVPADLLTDHDRQRQWREFRQEAA